MHQVTATAAGHLHSENYFWEKLLVDAKGQRPLEFEIKKHSLLGLDPQPLEVHMI